MCKNQCEINKVCVLKEKSYQLNVRYVYIFEHDFHNRHKSVTGGESFHLNKQAIL